MTVREPDMRPSHASSDGRSRPAGARAGPGATRGSTARAVETEVDQPRFSARLAAASIAPEHEEMVVGMLADGAESTSGAPNPTGARTR